MKVLFTIALAVLVMLVPVVANEEAQKGPYRTIPRFGIPDAFYTDHHFRPHIYLDVYKVTDTNAKLSHAEKLSAALLVIAADHANNEKYHQSYGVSLGNPLLILLQRNFPGLSEVEPSHDVNPGELPIRDLGAFFRTWLREDLSQDAQDARIKEIFEDEREQDAEQDADRPATAQESTPEGSE